MKISIALTAFAAMASAFSPVGKPCRRNTATAATRRESMEKMIMGTTTAFGMFVAQSARAADNATTKDQEEEFNELIDLLKARSDDNKEANANYAMRADKLSDADFKDAKMRRPKLIIVSTSNGNKILTKEEFKTLECDGKIDTVYGTRMKQGGGEMKDYNDITYILKD